MRWGKAKVKRLSAAQALRLNGERAQIEEILASTTNQALAEMARIKLRVIDFVRKNTSDDRDHEDTSTAAPLPQPFTVELPRSVSIVPSAHLIDLSRQQPMLKQIHNAAPHIEPPSPPNLPVDLSASGLFYASSRLPIATAWVHKRPVRVGAFFSLLIGILTLQVALAWDPVDPALLALGLLLVGVPFAVWSVAIAAKFTFEEFNVWWGGVQVARHNYSWDEIRSVSLTLREADCECEIEVRHGPTVRRVLTYFSPSFPDWVDRLRQVCAQPAAPILGGSVTPAPK